MKSRKTTQKEFSKFKEVFLHWAVDVFGFVGYTFFFELKNLEDRQAEILVLPNFCKAHIDFNTIRYPARVLEDVALHEALHLLTGHVDYLNHERFVIRNEVVEAEEALVCRLENIIKKLVKNA